MPADDSSYAPKSPDFSSFFSPDPAGQVQVPPLDIAATIQNQGPLQSPALAYDPSYIPPASYGQAYNVPSSSYQPPVLPHQELLSPSLPIQQLPLNRQFVQQYGQQYGQQYSQQYSPQYSPHYNQQYSQQYPNQPNQQWQPYHLENPSQPAASTSFTVPNHQPNSKQNYQPPSPPPTQSKVKMPPRKSRANPPPPVAPIIDSSMVKTKFPTARIKRIMQADEEVGKVAQQTPIAVGKALELFMIQLVSRSAEVAREKGSKRVTAAMLKQVVEADEQWDFLREIVSRVEQEKEGAKAKAKTEADTDSDEDKEPVVRNKRGAGRKKKKPS